MIILSALKYTIMTEKIPLAPPFNKGGNYSVPLFKGRNYSPPFVKEKIIQSPFVKEKIIFPPLKKGGQGGFHKREKQLKSPFNKGRKT